MCLMLVLVSHLNKSKMDAIRNTFNCNGNSINGNENIANAFNHHFTNTGSKLA